MKDAAGATVTATLETPEAYAFTAISAVAATERALAGGAGGTGGIPPGAWTPSRAFGPDFVTGLPGVVMGEVRRSQA